MNAEASHAEDLRALYRELILDHAKKPRNFRALDKATNQALGLNRMCGDRIRLHLELDGNRIMDASFEGTACAITLASASLLTTLIVGRTVDEAIALGQALHAHLSNDDMTIDGGSAAEELGELRALAGVREFPARVKCATLPWETLRSAVRDDGGVATTE